MVRNKPRSIVGYIVGFVFWFGLVVGLAYLLQSGTDHSEGESAGYTTLLIGGAMLTTIFLVPLFFLKQLTRLSRRVENDDSHFNIKDVPNHADRPRIQYY